MKLVNSGVVTGPGETTEITGQVIGSSEASGGAVAPEDPASRKGAVVNTGYLNLGGTLIVDGVEIDQTK